MTSPPAHGPAGRVVPDGDGVRIELRCEFGIGTDALWRALTEPDRLAAWIGTWSGDAAVGRTVQFQMLHEPEPCEPEPVTIEECAPAYRLVLAWVVPDEAGPWRIELTLGSTESGSELVVAQRLPGPDGASDVGSGWQWYVERLAAAVGAESDADGPAWPAAWESYVEDVGPVWRARVEAL